MTLAPQPDEIRSDRKYSAPKIDIAPLAGRSIQPKELIHKKPLLHLHYHSEYNPSCIERTFDLGAPGKVKYAGVVYIIDQAPGMLRARNARTFHANRSQVRMPSLSCWDL